MKKLSYEQALSRLAAYCSRSERCLWDIRRKLGQWELPASDQARIIQVLQKEKFLDEERYAFAFVRDKTRFNGWGIQRVRFELKRKSISSEIIEKALTEICQEETLDRLIALLKKKQASIKSRSEFETRQKLIRFAAGRGFLLGDIAKALGNLKI